MIAPVSFLALVAGFTLFLLLSFLNYSFWSIQREDRTPLWLAVWLGAGAMFALCRLLQYASLSEQVYTVIPRVMLTAGYALAWLGYEIANTFIGYRPARWERVLFMLLVAAPTILLWTSNLVLTDQVVNRKIVLGGEFHGVLVGSLYLPASFLILTLGLVPLLRLVRASNAHKRDNRWMAMGYGFVILFSLIDFLAISLNFGWIRLSDYSYLPIAIFFSYIQVQRFGRLYRGVYKIVHERTESLDQVNKTLSTEIIERKRVEEELNTAMLRLMALLEHMQKGILFEDDLRHITLANKPFCELFGIPEPATTLAGVESREVVQSSKHLMADPEGFIQRIETIIGEQRLVVGEELHLKDGRILERDYIPITVDDHSLGHLWQYRDITERKQDEIALRESEEKYRSVVEKANDGIAIVQNGMVRYVNPRLAELRGEKVEDIISQPFEKFIHPDERSTILERYQRRLAGENVPATYEMTLLHKDNSKVFAEVTTGLITYQGALAEIVMIRDITERKQTEEIRRESEEQYRRLVEHSPYGAVIHIQGQIVYGNPAAIRIVGAQNIEELLGKPVMDFVHPESRPAVMQRLGEVDQGKDVPLLQEKFIRLDGRVMDVEVVGYPFTYQNMLAVQVVFNDITEQKRAEERIRQQAAEMTTLYETTHDLVIEKDLSKLLYTIVERAAGLLKASGGGLYLCEPEQRQVRCAVSYNTPHNYTGVVLKYGEGAAGLVAETGEPLVVDDYRIWKGRAAVYEQDLPFVSLLSAPMCWRDRVVGVIHVLENSRPNAFTQHDLQVLILFANQAAIAVENARLFEFEQRRRQEAAAIAEVGRDISASLQLDVVLERIASHAKDLLHAETSAVYLSDPVKPILRAIAAIGPDAEEIKHDPLNIGEGILGNIAARKEGEIVNNSTTDPRAITIKGTKDIYNEHILGMPVLSRDHLTGLIAVWRVGEGNGFSLADLDFLVDLAQQAAIAIENASLFEAEQKRRKEAETLRDAAQKITSTLDQAQVIQLILEQLAKVVSYESASVQLLRDGYLEIIGGRGWPDPEAVLGLRFPTPGDNPNTLVIQARIPLILGKAALKEYPSFNKPPHSHIQSWLGVPLIVRDRVIGMFAVDHSQPDFFTDADAQMVNALAGQAAIAIENARLFEEAQKRLLEIEGIANVSAALGRTLELEPLLETILQSTIHAIPPAERGAILLADDEENLHVHAVWGYSDVRVRQLVFSPESGYSTISFQQRRAIIVPDVRAESRIRYEGDIPEMLTGGSAIAAPLIVKDRPIGVIAIDTPARENAFDEDDLHLLEALASSAALAIENARLFADTRRKLAELEILQTIASALRIAQTLDEVFPIILDLLINLLEFGSALVDLIDPSSGEIVTILAHGMWAPMTGMRTPNNVGGSGRVIATGEPYITTDVIADGVIAFPDLIGGLKATACVPIVAQHQPIGTLWVGRHTPIPREEISLLVAVGEMVGNTIQRMKLHEQTVNQADEIVLAYDLTLEGWAKAMELRDKETEGHSRRVSDLTLELARQFGFCESELAHIHRGVLLHDIGKMGVPDQVLKKPGPLNYEEWDEMRKHPQYAHDLLSPITYLHPAQEIPYCHHEKWDGSGYPRGLRGEQIPLSARIFAVVDVFDALSSDRPYRTAWPRRKVLNYLREQSGKHFDPRVVAAFMKLLEAGVIK
jgi:PAS domain S-box-containing protein